LLDVSVDAVDLVYGKRMSLNKARKINKTGNVRITQHWGTLV